MMCEVNELKMSLVTWILSEVSIWTTFIMPPMTETIFRRLLVMTFISELIIAIANRKLELSPMFAKGGITIKSPVRDWFQLSKTI